MIAVVLEVHGTPAPQGSKTRMPNGAMLEGGSATGRLKQKTWRADVRQAAEDWRAAHGEPEVIRGAVILSIDFRMPRPKSRRKDTFVVTKPDLSKLIRCTEDSLKDVIWHDDCLVVETHCGKRYANTDELPGATIIVEPVELS